MAASTSWRGAIEFAGFPVNVRLYNRVKSRSGESFKTLGPDDLPVTAPYVDSKGKIIEDKSLCSKAVMTGKDKFVKLSPRAIETIAAAKSTMVEPVQFAPLDTIPLELSVATYVVVPDDVPGADRAASIVWNGLKASGQAYVTDITLTGGGRDSILVVWANDKGMFASTLPYKAELHEVPTFEWEEDDEAAKVFEAFVANQYDPAPFDHDLHVSAWRQRRQAAIDAALAGKEPEVVTAAEPAVPDLMEALKAGLKAKKGKAVGVAGGVRAMTRSRVTDQEERSADG